MNLYSGIIARLAVVEKNVDGSTVAKRNGSKDVSGATTQIYQRFFFCLRKDELARSK